MRPILLVRLTLVGAALATLAAALPASAETNRLLPFWAQPYPTGFVQNEPDAHLTGSDCVSRHRIRAPHGWRTVVEDRCNPVLHARD